ncbi:MAG: ABC transporter permease, partial [Lentisphaeria bacterium]|nr:ABC transporter permease [Lentisphaeria bacterium]
KLGWPFYLIDPLRRKKPISLRRNPVFVAEIRSKIFGNPKFIIRALTACISLSLCLLVLIVQQVGETDLDNIRAIAIIFQIGVVALLAPTVSSGSITDERTSDTLLLLRLSPLTALKVVIGKMKAALLYVMIFLLSSLPVFLVLVYLDSSTTPDFLAMLPKGFDLDSLSAAGAAISDCVKVYWRVGAWVGVLITTCLVLTSAGLCSSCFSPSTGVATAVSYAFALAVTAGSLSVLLFSSRTSPELQAVFLMFNPFIAAMEITLDNSLASRLPAIWGNRLWVNHLLIFSGLTALLVAIAAIRVRFLFREQK